MAYGYGLFIGGLGAHYGAELIGATVIPMSGGNNKRQIMLMQDFGTTALACTPSYALALAETADEIESAIGLHAVVRLVEPKTIERSMGKRKRVIDLRKEPKP